MSDPKKSKGIVEREVVKPITPGTINDLNMLESDENLYLACIYIDDKCKQTSLLDIFRLTS